MSGLLLLLSIVLSILSDSAYALIVGLLLAGLWLSEPAPDPDPSRAGWTVSRRWLLVCGGILALSDLFRPWVLAGSMGGSLKLSDALPLIPQVLTATHQGTVWFIQSAAIAAFLTGAAFLSARRPRAACFAVSLIALSYSKAAAGHAGDAGALSITALLQMLHILATAVWSGGIAVSAFAIFRVPRVPGPHRQVLVCGVGIPRIWGRGRPRSEPNRTMEFDAVLRYARKLSATVTIAVAVLIATGIYAAFRETQGSVSALWTSIWGRVLLAKLVIVLAALALGAVNRFSHLRGPASAAKADALSRVLRVEAVMLLLVIGLSAVLGSVSPP